MSNSQTNQKKRYFFLIGGIFVHPTAIEIQACVRAKLFKKHLGITPTIITHGYSAYLPYDFQKYAQETGLDLDIPIFSLFDFYCDKILPAAENQIQNLPTSSNITYTADTEDPNKYWGMINEQLRAYVEYHPETQLIDYINYIDTSRDDVEVIKRDVYDSQGYLSTTSVVEPKNKQDQIKYFLDRKGRRRLTIHEKTANISNKLKIFAHNKHGMTTNIFNSKDELVADFLQKLADLYPQDELYFIVEHPIYYQALRKLKHQNAHTISVFHAIQTTTPDVEHAAFHGHFAGTLAEYKIQPAMKTVILTEQQKQDIEKRLCQADNLYVIPNTLNHFPKPIDFEKRDRFLLTALVRLNPTKQIDKMIAMFAIVHQAVPQAKLDIYGTGELQDSLQTQIDDLGLSNTITLKGFTNDSYAVFENAGLSLLTSSSEALPLVIMESLVCGCPFISFDIKYGPTALIEDGQNGYLIPPNDIQGMAEKIIYLLNNPQRHKEMSHQAYYGEKSFSMENVANQWSKLLQDINN